jgi:hypothetical protein
MIMEYFLYKEAEKNGQNGKVTENYYDPYSRYNNRIIIQQQVEPMSQSMMLLIFVFYLVLGIYAAKLSWYSNTKAGWSQGYKVLFALLAFMFPMTYISAHILFKLDLLSKLKGGSMRY